MRIELLPGMTNVVRFPVERRARPTLELLREIAPDVREVMAIAEAFDLAMPVTNFRDLVDRETAEHILNHVILDAPGRTAALDALLDPAVVGGLGACREAHDVSVAAAEAQEVLLLAQTAGRAWLDPLRERAEALTLRTAELMIEAHARVEAAEGISRAVSLARRGEPWLPRDHRADEDALFGPFARAVG